MLLGEWCPPPSGAVCFSVDEKGEATGAATSDGAVILPDKIAVFLFEKVPTGTRIIISP